jgi:hypothetical protein
MKILNNEFNASKQGFKLNKIPPFPLSPPFFPSLMFLYGFNFMDEIYNFRRPR